MSRIVVESGADVGMMFPLTGTNATIGRSANNSIQIIDRKISRHHAEIIFREGAYFFHDNGSKNGSFINEHPVKEDVLLSDGALIRIGETVLLYESGPAEIGRLADTTSKGIRVVDDLDWGSPRSSVAAGAHPLEGGELKAAAREAPEDSHRRLAILYQVADAIRNILNLEELLEQIMDIIYEVIQPDRGFIMLLDEYTQDLTPMAVKNRNEDDEEITISRTIMQQCIRDKVSILASDAASDQRFSGSESIIINKIRSVICSPLIYKDEIFGVIYADTLGGFTSYGQKELELVNGIANQSAMAIANAKLHARIVEQNKMAREMEIARTIQMNLLPKVYPTLDKIDISAMSLPAKKVGGDYYDFFLLPDGRYGIVIADVSGKGVPAAILLATTRASLLIEARQKNAGVSGVLTRMNEVACRDATNNMYVTMVYGILDPNKRSLEYSNAGHVYPLVFDASGKIRSLKTGACFLGIMENVEFESKVVPLSAGQTFIFYSDGVTDTMNTSGEFFGQERMKKVVFANMHKSAQDIRDAIYDACLEFRGAEDQFDDFTVLIMKIL